MAMKVKNGTGVTPIASRFHHLMTQKVTSASAHHDPEGYDDR